MAVVHGAYVCVGDSLGKAGEWAAGGGTFVRGDGEAGEVVAAVAGRAHVTRPPTTAAAGGTSTDGVKPTVSVIHRGGGGGLVFPVVGSLVTGRVVRISSNTVHIDILVIAGRPVAGEAFKGVVRRENVQDSEIDKIVMDECFRPGDLVTAVVVSLGDARAYLLSTASDDLGVVYAAGEDGEPLVPASLTEMVSPTSGARVKRKVARPPQPPSTAGDAATATAGAGSS